MLQEFPLVILRIFRGFANIYNDVYKKIYAEINNQKYDDTNDCYPTIHDGVEGMKFIETVLESSNNNINGLNLIPK